MATLGSVRGHPGIKMECIMPAIFTGSVLAVAGIADVRSREIDPVIWMASIPVAAGLYAYLCGEMLQALGSIIMPLVILAYVPAVVSLVLYKIGLIGGADVWALTLIAAGFPLHPAMPVPASIVVVVLGNITMMLHRALVTYRVCGVRCVFKARINVRVDRLLSDDRMMFWIVGSGRDADVTQEPWEAVARRALSGGDKVDASPGLPYVAHLALGFIVYVIVLCLTV